VAKSLDDSSKSLAALAPGHPAAEPSLNRMVNAARQAAVGLRDEDAHAHALLPPMRNADMPLMAWCLLDSGTFATSPVLAVSSTTSSISVDPVRRFHQMRSLISRLVESGLALAQLSRPQEDALNRAEYCTKLAKELATELGQTSEGREEELARRLQDLL